MRSYLSLIPLYARAHRRQNRMTLLCIVLSVFLVACIFGMADMEIRSQRLQAEKSDGAWHVMFSGLTPTQCALLSARPNVKDASGYGVLNYGLEERYTVGGEPAVICGVDAGFPELLPAARLTEGAFPDNDEMLLTESARERLHLALGDRVPLQLPDGSERTFTVSGFQPTTAMLTERDAIGVILNMDAFRALSDDLGLPPQDGRLYVRFSSDRGVQANIHEVQTAFDIPDENVQENVKLLGTLGQSRDSYLVSLYTAACILAVLVVAAGTMMIGSSLNANIARRTEFFGLLRCLGATPKQIRGYVRLEALSWCAFAIPLGVLAAVAVTWLLCLLLRLTSPGYFSEMPAFGVSGIAVFCGVFVGIVTVLLAAGSPARRASRVSPLTALHSSGDAAPSAKHGAGIGLLLLPVEAALGVRHATMNRKNLLLMAGSFALSILLFLSFAPAISFMRHAIRPLAPYTPDVSLVSSERACAIPAAVYETLMQDPAVKRVYGRMFAYDVPVTADGRPLRVNLVSYEQHQFRWARSSLIHGALAPAVSGEAILTVYHAASPLSIGTQLTGDFGTGNVSILVCGVLSDSPFTHEDSVETVICSEAMFRKLTGENAYTILDIQLSGKATEADVSAIRELGGAQTDLSDRRLSNQEIRGAFYSMSLFLYGFLAIIALIAAFNIINSMAMSVSARVRQYGAMRAIGMSDAQLKRMVFSEAVTYAVCGILTGCAVGVPLNKAIFALLVTSHWGDGWTAPLLPLAIIVGIVAASAVLSAREPIRRISGLTIVETIRAD